MNDMPRWHQFVQDVLFGKYADKMEDVEEEATKSNILTSKKEAQNE